MQTSLTLPKRGPHDVKWHSWISSLEALLFRHDGIATYMVHHHVNWCRGNLDMYLKASVKSTLVPHPPVPYRSVR